MYETSGLYYKHMTIVNDNSSIIIKWGSKLIDTARGVIYNRHMFIVQATSDRNRGGVDRAEALVP